MKNLLLIIVAGSVFATGGAVAQSTITTTAQTPTLTGTNSTFSFSRFDSSLGNLTAVDLLLNSASVSGSISVFNDSDDPNTLLTLQTRVRIWNAGLTPNPRSTSITQLISVLTPTPAEISPGDTQGYSLSSSQSLISGQQVYGVSGSPWASFQAPNGTGTTPIFTASLINAVTFLEAAGNFPDVTYSLSGATNFTLRYTYTPAPAPVPEPGQVAASLLLLGGIGAYVFIKRRKKSAPAAV